MHADTPGAEDAYRRIGDLQHQACPVFDRAAIGIGAPVRAVLQKLVEKIAVRAMDLDAVKARGLGVLGPLAKGFDEARDLLDGERARRDEGLLRPDLTDVTLCRDRARRDRQGPVEINRIGDAPDMPELQNHASTRPMHGLGDRLPARHLFLGPDARRSRIADAHRRHRRRLREDEPGRGALRIIIAHHRVRHTPLSARAAARQGRQEDAVRKPQIAEVNGVEERGHVFGIRVEQGKRRW